MIEFNVNDYVFVKLTKAGVMELRRQFEELRHTYPLIRGTFSEPKTDKDGWSKRQLHSLMYYFGHMMHPGSQIPFETDIRLVIGGGK